jgi:hypothetical protein
MPELPEMFWRAREHREEDDFKLLPIIPAQATPSLTEYRTHFHTHNVQVRSKYILREVERAIVTNRNKCLHWGAARFGNMIAEGVITQEVAEDLLVKAAKRNGLWKEDGAVQCLATIRGGIRRGIREWQRAMRRVNREQV